MSILGFPVGRWQGRYHFPWSDPEVVAANKLGVLHPQQRELLRNRNIWLVYPLVMLFVGLPCASCAWFGCNQDVDLSVANSPQQWVCGSPLSGVNLLRDACVGVILLGAIALAYQLVAYDRRYRERLMAERIHHAVGRVTFQSSGLRGRTYVAQVGDLRLRPFDAFLDPPPPGAYMLYFYPQAKKLLSADPLPESASAPAATQPWAPTGERSPLAQLQAALAQGIGFTDEELSLNREGRMSTRQRWATRGRGAWQVWGFLIGVVFLGLAAYLSIPGIVDAMRHGGQLSAWNVSALIFGIVVLISMIIGWWQAGPRLTLSSVGVYDGPITKDRQSDDRGLGIFCGSMRLKIGWGGIGAVGGYNALLEGYHYRVYYSTRTMTVLSVEVLGQM